MTKRTRFIILAICGALFVAITPYIILYSLGYRVNFQNLSIMPTGGLYVKTSNPGTTIAIDSARSQTTGLLTPYVFSQNLLPGKHSVLIKKDGYYDYQKNLQVLGKQVTKLEHVTLFKKNIAFTQLQKSVDYFSIAPNGVNMFMATAAPGKIMITVQNIADQTKVDLAIKTASTKITDLKWSDDSSKAILALQGNYYLIQPYAQTPSITLLVFSPGAKDVEFNNQNTKDLFYIKNGNLYSNRQAPAIVKNVLAYKLSGSQIIWFSGDGLLYHSDLDGAKPAAITSIAFPIKKAASHNIITGGGMTILQEDASLFSLDQKTQTLQSFYGPATDIKFSPDGKQVVYYTDHQITYYPLDLNANPLPQAGPLFPGGLPETIKQVYWLNNDYVAIYTPGKIIISEVDIRGNVNMIDIKYSPNNSITQASYNDRDQKIYLLENKNIASSEKLLP